MLDSELLHIPILFRLCLLGPNQLTLFTQPAHTMATTNLVNSSNSTSQDVGILCGDEEPKIPHRTSPEPQLRGLPLELPQAAVLFPRFLPLCLREPPLMQPTECLESRRRRAFRDWDLHSHDRGAHPLGIVSANVSLRPAVGHSDRDGSMRMRRHRDALIASPATHTPRPFRCGSMGGMRTNEPLSSVAPRDAPPNSGLAAPLNTSFSSSSGGTFVFPDPAQFEQGTHPSPYELYPKIPETQLPPRSVHVRRCLTWVGNYAQPPPSRHRLSPATCAGPERKVLKRYQCRMHEFGCEKMFTTPGHESRHFRINKCEKTLCARSLAALKRSPVGTT